MYPFDERVKYFFHANLLLTIFFRAASRPGPAIGLQKKGALRSSIDVLVMPAEIICIWFVLSRTGQMNRGSVKRIVRAAVPVVLFQARADLYPVFRGNRDVALVE